MTSAPHDSSHTHVTGESEFIDDRPFVAGELVVGIVCSQVARGKLVQIDLKKALAVPGVVGAYTAKDLSENYWGTIFQDQPIFAAEDINYFGEPLCALACETPEALRKARRLVEVKVTPLVPILSIAEARKKMSFIAPPRVIQKGNVEDALKNAPHRIKGKIEMAGQEHFYLESQAAIAYPGEAGQIAIHSSTQHPTEIQHVVAHALGLSYSDVVCIVKRMGGAFGGKESQGVPFAVIAALIAKRTGRAARVVITKDEDMVITGKRNPFENDYEVGFDNDGRILGLKVNMFSDSGAYADLSTAIMERAMLHCDNAYFIPHIKIEGLICRTNFSPTTAFRGFGGPKGVATIENILEEIAEYLKKDALDIRELNCYQGTNNVTPYGQTITQEIFPRLFKQLRKTSNYDQRKKEVADFNRVSKTHVRGLSMTAVKFGISFTTRFLNQGSALVNLHLDGTVQVSTGATEMGQGVNTKISTIVAEVFAIPQNAVFVMPTSTEKIHNTSPTAASSGSDINGSAAQLAAETIKRRLQLVADKLFNTPKELRGRKPAVMGLAEEFNIVESNSADHIEFENEFVFNRSNPGDRVPLKEVIEAAYLNRISLGAHGYYRYPGIHYNKETGQGNPFFYFTNGVGASEVSIDRFTGEVKVLRTDILMDLGRPINHGVDYGQTTGAFIQGLGWVTTEKLYYNKDGSLLTRSPSTYKIPSVQDIPRIFNIDFLINDENRKNLSGSKAVGEPPLLLAISVWTAIKNALSASARKKPVTIKLPATQEEILMNLY
ncbi:MAG: xanthine dehydrogenase molybdopterin binding subunit [Pseudomonadota bacterium]|nr:xanthine dehydrogenase molybdopterin binding subunit [Pseudomonadota bacterium]